MRTAVLQFAAGTDVTANLATISRLSNRAADSGADLIVMPEAAMHDFGDPDLPLGPVAQPVDGAFVSTLAEVAKRTGATLVAGMFEVSADPTRPYNTLVAVGTDGTLLASYRKTHLYDSFGYRESAKLLGGEPAATVLSMGDLTLGLMTCYDLRFPEFGRLLVDAGADVLLVPAAWVRGTLKEDHWSTLLRARAIENTVYVVGAGQTGRTYIGCSMVVDPMGVAVAQLGDEESTAVADLDAARIAAVRQTNPSLDNRRLPVMR